MNPDKFGKGAYEDRIDTRDFQWSEVGFGTAPYDWSKSYNIEEILKTKLPVKDQGQSSSCGGQAWASYASALEVFDDKTFEERSAKFIYAQTYVPGGGTYGRDNANLFVSQGVAREALLTSYENGQAPSEEFITRGSDINNACRIDAAQDRAFSYANVEIDIDTVAQAIQANKGLILGVRGENNGTWLSPYPKAPSSVGVWGHWVYAGKIMMENGIKFIGILNSWGTSVGAKGWQWLSEDYFTSTGIFQVWTHVFNPNPVVPIFKYKFIKQMKYGDNSEDVRRLQTALQINGTFRKTLAPTGFYGAITRKAVLDFQLKYKIADRNYLLSLGGKNSGPLTLKQLNLLYS
jgi:hypothetical protein